jgi:hypothetical protein
MKNMRYLLLLIIAVTLSQIGFSQNRAPSCWLKYQDYFQGDILINTLKVQSPSPTYTYYCALQWNAGAEGGGYCGIQEHPDGRNFIFSIWDPIASSDPIIAPYAHTGTIIESFGGEGTGLKSWNFDIDWDTDQWYSFVTRAWNDGAHTMFGYWVLNHTTQEWYHLVTMDYPVPDVRYNSNTGSFIEDWLGNGSNAREIHHKEGWKRKTSDLSWNAFTSSYFDRVSPDTGAVNYIDNYDGGVASDYYFMKSGGASSPITSTSGTTLSLSNSNAEHGFPLGEIAEMNKTVSDNILTIDWSINVSKSPQFSYHVEIYDNPSFLGNPAIQMNQIIPHARTSDIDISSLVAGNQYYIQFYIIDIFDKRSAAITDSFIEQTMGIKNMVKQDLIRYYPNPFQDKIHLNFNGKIERCSIKLKNTLGSILFSNEYYMDAEMELHFPENMEKGIYFLSITDQNEIQETIKLLKH